MTQLPRRGLPDGIEAAVTGQLLEEFNVLAAPNPSDNVFGGGDLGVGLAYARTVAGGQEAVTGRRVRPMGMPLPGSPLRNWGRNRLAVRGPTAAADDAAVGTVAWSSAASALQLDVVRATAVAVPAVSGVTHYLVLTGFGFALPSDATVLGIRVQTYAGAGATSAHRWNAVRLVKGGVISGDDKFAENTTALSTTDRFDSFGDAADLWGQAWTYADVNASTFGVALSMKNLHATTTTDARIDFANIVVAYSRPGNLTDEDLLGRPRPAGVLAPAVGCMECADTLTEDAAVYHVAPPSGRLDGYGTQDFDVPLEAGAATLTVWARKNAAYTGSGPHLRVLNGAALGLSPATPSDSLSVAADTWEALTLSVTVVRAGVLKVRFESASEAAAGAAWFDDFEAS